jgi:hypothetical protein
MVRIVFFRTFNEIVFFLSGKISTKKKKNLRILADFPEAENPHKITLNDKIHRKSLENICGFFSAENVVHYIRQLSLRGSLLFSFLFEFTFLNFSSPI